MKNEYCNHAVVACALWQSVVTVCLILQCTDMSRALGENIGTNEPQKEHLDAQRKCLAATHWATRAA